MKTQDHAPNMQMLGPPSPPEPEPEAQESARLGAPQVSSHRLTPSCGYQPRGFQPGLMLGRSHPVLMP